MQLWLKLKLFLWFQVAIPDVKDAAENADILIFVLPHQFVRGVCKQLDGKVNPGAIAVSLIKVQCYHLSISSTESGWYCRFLLNMRNWYPCNTVISKPRMF